MKHARIVRTTGETRRLSHHPKLVRVVSARQQWAAAQLAQAQAHAAALLSTAEREAEGLKAQAEARWEAEFCARMLDLERQAVAARDAWMERYRQKLASLALLVAEQILRRELEHTPETLSALVGSVLREVAPAQDLVVRIHPDDHPVLQQEITELTRVAQAQRLRLHADATVERGGCIIETPLLQIDGQLRTRLAALKHALEQELNRELSERDRDGEPH